jgi:hypothetical protein
MAYMVLPNRQPLCFLHYHVWYHFTKYDSSGLSFRKELWRFALPRRQRVLLLVLFCGILAESIRIFLDLCLQTRNSDLLQVSS